MTNKPITILWQKWTNPYESPHEEGSLLEDLQEKDLEDNWDTYQDTPEETAEEYEQSEESSEIVYRKNTKAIITPMGIIPMDESTACTKIFKFWIGHTNFNISEKINNLIENVNGVEILDVFTRYRFRIAIGQAFKDREVMQAIQERIYESKSE
jgi:hypothetical protein